MIIAEIKTQRFSIPSFFFEPHFALSNRIFLKNRNLKKMKHLFLFFFLSICSVSLLAQSVCDDAQAKNFKAVGACEYPKTKKGLKKVCRLANEVNETSGLIYDNGFLWTHNDSGGEPTLYKIDIETGEVVKKVHIQVAEMEEKGKINEDWEELAADEEFFYIGDMGNNKGNRKDLKIYRIRKSELEDAPSVNIMAEIISFDYPEQTDFNKRKLHDFDCEGFFYANNELHLFTKNRATLTTNHYIIPAEIGHHEAILQENLAVDGLITGADISENGTVILVGYSAEKTFKKTTHRKVFMWICWDYDGAQYFSGKTRRIELGATVRRGQMEAVCFSEGVNGYVSAEGIPSIQQHLRAFSLEKWLDLGN